MSNRIYNIRNTRILHPKNTSRHDLGQNPAQPYNIIIILGPPYKRLGVFFVNLLSSPRYANVQRYCIHIIIIKLARRRLRRRRITDIILLSFGVCARRIFCFREIRAHARGTHTHTHTRPHDVPAAAATEFTNPNGVHAAPAVRSGARRDSPPPPRRHRDLGKK